MGQTLITVALFVVLLALLPLVVKWLQKRSGALGPSAMANSRLVSALGVGPHQKVITVEVGPEGARTWLVLGVTAQTITCLHTMPAAATAPTAAQAGMRLVEPVMQASAREPERG